MDPQNLDGSKPCSNPYKRRQRSGTFTWCPAKRCSLQTQILESGPTHPACAMGVAQPPFSTTGATVWCPQAWRTAKIVPFSKKENDPQAVSSYRPIALASTIGKFLERLIANRLSWWLEAKSLLSPWQAGFLKRRCTSDQCLRLSQFVSDGFQSTNKERTVHMLFDYFNAYDTVWRTGLLQKMPDIGVP